MNLQTPEQTPAAVQLPVRTLPGQYLMFKLGKDEFGIDVLHVREIVGMQDIAALPGAPPHLKGVINLRGKIIPVVDLRLKFALPEAPFTHAASIIVIQIAQTGNRDLIGLLVDGISRVLTHRDGEVEGASRRLGIAKYQDSHQTLLEVEDLLNPSEFHRTCETTTIQ